MECLNGACEFGSVRMRYQDAHLLKRTCRISIQTTSAQTVFAVRRENLNSDHASRGMESRYRSGEIKALMELKLKNISSFRKQEKQTEAQSGHAINN